MNTFLSCLESLEEMLTFKLILLIMQQKVDKLDIEELEPVPVDLAKFRDVVKSHVVKNVVYDKLVPK